MKIKTSKTGKLSFLMPESEYVDLCADNAGICISCAELADGCEPDARMYKCESCGCLAVFGIEELLMMGRIEFSADDHDE